jgi:Mitochondrial carrier protein
MPQLTTPTLLQSTVLGGSAAMFAVNFTHPIELVKTRVQVTQDGIIQTCSSAFRKEGVLAFWKGIPFAYCREGSYTAIRLGAYAPVRDAMGAGSPDSPIYLKFLAGAITGGVGSVAGNPFDVLKTLAQTNQGKSLPLSSLVGDMYRNQGIRGFYRGVEVNVMRACVLNATNMGVYDISKGYVEKTTGWSRKDPKTAFCSSFVAGFFMTCTVAPFDMLRTRLMNQPVNEKLYSGFSDCLVKTIQQDGFLRLWRGFVPIWARFAPMATLQLLTIEFLYGTFGFKSI